MNYEGNYDEDGWVREYVRSYVTAMRTRIPEVWRCDKPEGYYVVTKDSLVDGVRYVDEVEEINSP